MSATISSDLLEWSSFDDVYSIEIHRDLLVIKYPRHAKFLEGSRVHTLAPLFALGEPLPTVRGPTRESLGSGRGAILVSTAGAFPDGLLRPKVLPRPIHHPAGTSFFLIDSGAMKRLVRLTEFCRMGINRRGEACLVFNDYAYIFVRRSGSVADFKTALLDGFPKTKSGCGSGDFSGLSEWSDECYLLPGLSQHFGVQSIEEVTSIAAVSDSSWEWDGPLVAPKPHGRLDRGMSL